MSKYTVCLDPGHGGKDPGAVNQNRTEKEDVRKATLRIGALLEASGIEVIYTRTTDIYLAPVARANISNQVMADLFVSIHRNSAANATAKGTEILVYSNSGKKSVMAGSLCARYAALGFTNRGIKERRELAVLKHTVMPAVLLELGFISNSADNQLFDNRFEEICRATAEEICSFLGTNLKAGEPAIKRTGWVKEGGKYYYIDPTNGARMTGFILVDGKTYYMQGDGTMLTEPRVFTPGPDGALY